MTDAELIVDTIVKTLRQVAPNCDGDNDHSYLERLADNIEAGPAEWTRCPLCEEIICTAGCALGPVLNPPTTADPATVATREALMALPDGTILRDAVGEVVMINRPRKLDGSESLPGEVWLNHFSDEYARILRPGSSEDVAWIGPIIYPLTVLDQP